MAIVELELEESKVAFKWEILKQGCYGRDSQNVTVEEKNLRNQRAAWNDY